MTKTRWLSSSLVMLVCLFGFMSWQMAKPDKAGADILGIPTPCDVIPNQTASNVCGGIINPIAGANNVIGAIPGVPNPSQIPGKAIGKIKDEVVSHTVEPMLREVAKFFGMGVIWGLKMEIKFITRTTSPNLNAAWFSVAYQQILWLAYIWAYIAFMYRLVKGAKEADLAIHFSTFFKMGVFIALTGGMMLTAASWLVTLVDKKLVPELADVMGVQLGDVMKNVEGYLNQIIAGQLGVVAVLFTIFVIGTVLSGATLFVMVFRYMFIPLLILAALFALAHSIGEESWDRAKKAFLTIGAWIAFPAILLFVLQLGLAMTLEANDAFTTMIILCATTVMPLIIGIWAIKKISGADFKVEPVKRAVIARAYYTKFRSS